MTALDVAGVVGTWTAAGLGLIALLGVLGPWLVWRAARTERHKAIVAVGTQNSGFISKGVPLWPGFRFGQRVRVPKIDKERKFRSHEWKTFDSERIKEIPDSDATWVSLATFLRGYDVDIQREQGDHLKISRGRTFLPVHKMYIYVFALLGRYGEIKKRRRTLLSTSTRGWRSSRTVPTFAVDGVSRQRPDEVERNAGFRSDHPVQPDFELHGVTGSLTGFKFNTDSREEHEQKTMIYFTPESLLEPLKTVPETLDLLSIFLMADGYLKAPGSLYFNILDPPKERAVDALEPDDSSSSEEYARPPPPPPREQMYTQPRYPQPMYTEVPLGSRPMPNIRFGMPRSPFATEEPEIYAFELTEISLDDDRLKAFPSEEVCKFFVVSALKLDSRIRAELEAVTPHTFVPADTPWVRLNKSAYYNFNNVLIVEYIRRRDVQKLAYALLALPWHPDGYLFPNYIQPSKATSRLCSISDRAHTLLQRMRQDVQTLDLDANERARFLSSADLVIKKSASQQPSRHSLVQALYALDVVLEELQRDLLEIGLMIGVLMITNDEFATLVYQSARHLDVSSQSRVEIDMRAGKVKVPSTFGVVQTFEVDVHVLDFASTRSRDDLSVKHSAVLIAALRASIRSQMLSLCIPSGPLHGMIGKDRGDVFHLL